MPSAKGLRGVLRSGPILLMLGLGGMAVSMAGPSLGLTGASGGAITDSPKEVIDQVWQIVYRDYLDSSGTYTDDRWRQLRKDLLKKSYGGEEESYEAIRGMLDSLDDPYTRFLDPKEFKEMRIDTSGELMGVGIQISLDKDTKELIVVAPIEGTPASRAGVQSKDVIVSIDGTSTKGMTTEDAVKLIRGPEGTEVILGLRRKGDVINVPLTRTRIEINAVKKALNTSPDGRKIGYIRLKQFNANASREMRDAIQELEDQGADGYVLDLRSNPGGLLEASVDIARQWLNEGIIVSTRTREGIRDVRRATGSAITDKPMVVLIDEGSASASEIVSGALQENDRAQLIGKTTFGKGLVQAVRGLSDGSGMTVTIAKYLTPNGTDIHNNGIKPDIEAVIPDKELEDFKVEYLGTGQDSQYKIAEETLLKSLNLSESKVDNNVQILEADFENQNDQSTL
ncbi:S41 family peptidase [Synechococcus sp. A15-24]|uniref:S41 family peptidase n=1 Tax=Synechococcus sp. A15-24 TaxID=1050635 RepID=UPI0016468F75|nr:S41 family peptidase [Synechococcus sp. A15-24]QNJ28953.1 photosystem II D1 protein carboxyl-terminal processing peptidase [Synechococcus sp. A15-24]